jgi:hypothetical protein
VTDGLPTPRTTLRTGYARVLVFCNSCRHQAAANLQALVDSGRGDVPLTALRFRCSQCHTDRTDFVVTSRDVVSFRRSQEPRLRSPHPVLSGDDGSLSESRYLWTRRLILIVLSSLVSSFSMVRSSSSNRRLISR